MVEGWVDQQQQQQQQLLPVLDLHKTPKRNPIFSQRLPPKKQKRKRVGALSTLKATFTSSLSLSLDSHSTQFTCSGNQNNTAQFSCSTNQHNTNNTTQFTLLWKPNTKHTHTQQQHNTQKQKSLKKRATIPNLQTQKKMFFLTLTFNPPPPPR
jgi:hypothetical protein